MVQVKWKTLIKGILWEILGSVTLWVTTWVTTGDFDLGGRLSLVYATIRALMFYPYERAFKAVIRKYVNGS